MRSVVTTMEELESSRQKLADNLDRNVRHEVVSLYNGTDNQSCKTIKEQGDDKFTSFGYFCIKKFSTFAEAFFSKTTEFKIFSSYDQRQSSLVFYIIFKNGKFFNKTRYSLLDTLKQSDILEQNVLYFTSKANSTYNQVLITKWTIIRLKYSVAVYDQARKLLLKKLSRSPSTKESKKSLDKIADDHEEKLLKYLSLTTKSKGDEIRESENGLRHYRKQFHTLALDYTFNQNIFHFSQRTIGRSRNKQV